MRIEKENLPRIAHSFKVEFGLHQPDVVRLVWHMGLYRLVPHFTISHTGCFTVIGLTLKIGFYTLGLHTLQERFLLGIFPVAKHNFQHNPNVDPAGERSDMKRRRVQSGLR